MDSSDPDYFYKRFFIVKMNYCIVVYPPVALLEKKRQAKKIRIFGQNQRYPFRVTKGLLSSPFMKWNLVTLMASHLNFQQHIVFFTANIFKVAKNKLKFNENNKH